MKISVFGVSTIALSLVAGLSFAQQPMEGVHYEALNEPYGVGEGTVISIFSPACPHCYRLEKPLGDWIEEGGYQLERMPFFHEDRWVEASRLILAMQATENDGEELIAALFDAIHEGDVDEEDGNALLSSLPVDAETRAAIDGALGSNEVSDQESQIRAWLEENRIVVVPTVVVNDHFFSDPARSRGNDNLILLLDYIASRQ